MGDLTGGYIFRREGSGKGRVTAVPPFDWLSAEKSPDQYGNQILYTYHYPKEDVITPAQKTYLQGFVAKFEAMMKSPDWASPTKGYPAAIDVTSWVDYVLMSELSNNVDSYWKSVYYAKEPEAAGGKLHIMPLWDYNIAFGNTDYREGWKTDILNTTAQRNYGGECEYQQWLPRKPPLCAVDCCQPTCKLPSRCWNTPLIPFYWEKLLADKAFQTELKCRWRDLRKGPISTAFVDARFDEWKKQIAPLAVPRHLKQWPLLLGKVMPNPYDVDKTSAPVPGETPAQFFEREVTWLRNWIDRRIKWLDANLPGTCDR
jgi:hypothetical protein